MTRRDEFEALAKKAGLAKHGLGWTAWESQLERFAELLVDHWQGRYYAQEGMTEKYKEMMDAHAKELDKAMELLRWAETEMRYAAWHVRSSDNHGRTDVYEAIKEFLK